MIEEAWSIENILEVNSDEMLLKLICRQFSTRHEHRDTDT